MTNVNGVLSPKDNQARSQVHTFMIGCYRTVHPDGVPIAEERSRVPCRSQRYLHYFVTMGMTVSTHGRQNAAAATYQFELA